MKYFLVNKRGERDVTKQVLPIGIQAYYHAVLKHISQAMGVSLYKETDGKREFIYNIP